MDVYEVLLADALDGMGPTSLMRMRHDGDAMFEKHPVAIEDIPEPGTKEAAIREHNDCHNPKGEDGGQFCGDGIPEHFPGKPWRKIDTPVDRFEYDLDIKTEQVDGNSEWSYLETPKGRATFLMKDQYASTNDKVELHWLLAEKRGAGRAAMARIVALADKHGVTLGLWAQPLPGQGENEGFSLSKPRLEAFYAGFGFVPKRKEDGTRWMERKPKKLREYNHCHNPEGDGGGQFCGGTDAGGVPVEPGSTPLPKGMIRAYHYTNGGPEALASILKTGLSTTHAKGSTYGEPNAIWFSTAKPGDFKHYVEVFLTPEELKGGTGAPNWVVQRPDGWKVAETPEERQEVIDKFNAVGGNFTAGVNEIPASRIVTHSVPWMAKYRAVLANPKYLQMVRDGKMDKVPQYAEIVAAIKRSTKTKEARVREFNDCNLPAGDRDGGRFGANADPRCGTSGMDVAQDTRPRTRKAKTTGDPSLDALSTALGQIDVPARAGKAVLEDVFSKLDPESRAKMLHWSFADGVPPRESLMVMDPTHGGPVDLTLRGSAKDNHIDSVEGLARSEGNEDLLRSTDPHGLKRPELYDRTAAALEEGVLLGVKQAVPVPEAIRDQGLVFHTHPSSRTFSFADVGLAVRSKYQSIGVIGRDGSEYALRIKKGAEVNEGLETAAEEAINYASYVTAGLLLGREQGPKESERTYLDAGQAAAKAKGWDIQQVNASVHGMMLTGVYRAMADQGWIAYGERVSKARQAEYSLHTNGQAEHIAETVRQAFTTRWKGGTRYTRSVHFYTDILRPILGGRQQGSGSDVRTSKEAAAALKDAAWVALVEFNKCHNPEGADGGQFCSDPKSVADIQPKKAYMDEWAVSKGFASIDDFWTKRVADDPVAKAIEYDVTRAHELAWSDMVDHALAMGVIDQQQAKDLGHYLDGNVTMHGGYKPLPKELFHVATASSAIMQAGIKSRKELGQQSGVGLGGGEDDSISFTADITTARAIRQAVLEAHAVANGKLTVERMLQMAEESTPYLLTRPNTNKGTMYGESKAPFYQSFVRLAGGGATWQVGDPLPPTLQSHLDGIQHVSEYSDEGKALKALSTMGGAIPLAKLPAGYTALSTHQGRDEVFVFPSQIVRPMTQEERVASAFAIYKTWAFARDASGGKLDPLFFSSDPKALARMPRSEIRILRFKPRTPKAQGYQVSSLGEWRIKTGDAVKFDGIVESRKPLREFNPCHEPEGEKGGQFTFRGTGNCDAEGHPIFTPSTKSRGKVELYGHDKSDPWNAAIAKHVLGDHDPTEIALALTKYFDEPLTFRMGSSSLHGSDYVSLHAGAPSGTWFTRVFRRHPDGTLTIDHSHFENHGADAQGKGLMQGQIEVYEKLGAETIFTTANISTGAYAWARYGFTSASPEAFAATIRERMATAYPAINPLSRRTPAQQYAAVAAAGGRFSSGMRAVLAPYEAQIEAALANPDPTTPWKVADLRIHGTEQELAPLVRAFAVRGNEVFDLSVKQGTRWNLQMRKEAIGGTFNLGRVLMAGLAWEARLDLGDKPSMRRLRAYLRGDTSRAKEAAIREFNKAHEPKGATDKNQDGRGDGGQFAKKETTAAPSGSRVKSLYDGQDDGMTQKYLGMSTMALAHAFAKNLDEDVYVSIEGHQTSNQIQIHMEGIAGPDRIATKITRIIKINPTTGKPYLAYHEIFRNVGHDGQGKGLMQAQVELYDALGIRAIRTSANINTGAYAWARYGFQAEEPTEFYNTVRNRMDRYERRHPTRTDWDPVVDAMAPYMAKARRALGKGGTSTLPWKIADLRLTGTPAELQPLVDAFTLHPTQPTYVSDLLSLFPDKRPKEVARWNALVKREAAEGTFNLGRVLLTGMSWDAVMDLKHPKARARLKAYIGS